MRHVATEKQPLTQYKQASHKFRSATVCTARLKIPARFTMKYGASPSGSSSNKQRCQNTVKYRSQEANTVLFHLNTLGLKKKKHGSEKRRDSHLTWALSKAAVQTQQSPAAIFSLPQTVTLIYPASCGQVWFLKVTTLLNICNKLVTMNHPRPKVQIKLLTHPLFSDYINALCWRQSQETSRVK